ncbi:MAG: hypothetical protein IPJ00_10825 [Saprospirales bacterium]|nr:hypothetical protein [Saprospirales bacterium]
MTQNKISVAEALKKIELGQSIADYSIDFDRIKVEALDVMKLAKAGVIVPEVSIFYDDEDIVYDEDFEGDWKRIDYDPVQEPEPKMEVQITLKKDVRRWVEKEHIKLDKLVEILVDGFYRSQKVAKEE